MDCKIAENNFHIKTDRLKLFDAAVGAVPAAAAAAIAPACEVGGGKNHESLYGKVKVRPSRRACAEFAGLYAFFIGCSMKTKT
jgi:hypothetical protein